MLPFSTLMNIFGGELKLSKGLKYLSVIVCVTTEIVCAVLFKESPYMKQVISYTNNFYVAGLNMFFGLVIYFTNREIITMMHFFLGITIGLLEFVLNTEYINMDITIIYFKFCESFTIVLLFMLTEIVSRRMKRLELNTFAVILSTVILSVFVFVEVQTYNLPLYLLLAILLLSAFTYILKHLTYSAQTIAPFILANDLKLAILFITHFFDTKGFYETKDMLYKFWENHKVAYVFYIICQVIHSISEFFCLKHVDLDILMVSKIISVQSILIYKKLIEK